MAEQRKPDMKRRMEERHAVAAAKALEVLESATDPQDAQICITLMVAYMCQQFDLNPHSQAKLIENNIRILKGSGQTMQVLNRMHAELSRKNRFFIPDFPRILTQSN